MSFCRIFNVHGNVAKSRHIRTLIVLPSTNENSLSALKRELSRTSTVPFTRISSRPTWSYHCRVWRQLSFFSFCDQGPFLPVWGTWLIGWRFCHIFLPTLARLPRMGIVQEQGGVLKTLVASYARFDMRPSKNLAHCAAVQIIRYVRLRK